MRLKDIAIETAPFGGRAWPIIELIDDWAARVLKLRSDALAREQDADAWTLEDMVGALHLRDAIDSVCPSNVDGPDVALPPCLTAADELFVSFTSLDVREIVMKLDPDAVPSRWWWRRLPGGGPLRAEALDVARRLGIRLIDTQSDPPSRWPSS